ncbi:MAG: Sir2 silent information regulator family NAD-dependent deacetylase, partial [Eubacterium sp.]|nr:Sir2 silent information regulator family NAD-dependent deacetylase [Eubacterium sp.]
KFVEDDGWHKAYQHYAEFTELHKKGKVLYLELGVGYNTPVIIKYPFWQYTNENPDATYVCINKGEANAPTEIRKQSICIDGDIDKVINDLI